MRTRLATMIAILAVGCFSLSACNGDDGGGDDDSNGNETRQDTGLPDGPGDTGTEEDTSDDGPEDTGTERDTNDPTNDTGTDDTGTNDTGAEDTGPDDTGTNDTGTRDTSVGDTGGTSGDAGSQDGGAGDVGSGDTVVVDTGSRDGGSSDTTPSRDGGTLPETGTGDTTTQDGGMRGESSIRTIRQQAKSLSQGQSLSGTFDVDGVVVTSVKMEQGNIEGVHVQEPSGPKANSGIWVFLGNAQSSASIPSLKRGNLINLEGRVKNFKGLTEIDNISSIKVAKQSTTVPSPVLVQDPKNIAKGGARAYKLEGVLVRVENVSISNVTIKNNQPEFGVVTLVQGLQVDDEHYTYFNTYKFQQGTTYTFVKGPLHFSFGNKKIMPRDKNDIDGPTRSNP